MLGGGGRCTNAQTAFCIQGLLQGNMTRLQLTRLQHQLSGPYSIDLARLATSSMTMIQLPDSAKVMEPKCDSNLTSWQFKSCQLLSKQAGRYNSIYDTSRSYHLRPPQFLPQGL